MILKNILIKGALALIIVVIVLIAHLLVNDSVQPSLERYALVYSYSINVLLALATVSLIFLLKKSFKDFLGFIFMGMGMLKFGLFFILFYPGYKADGDLSQLEFLAFFIPYAICLVIECVILSKLFNSLDELYS